MIHAYLEGIFTTTDINMQNLHDISRTIVSKFVVTISLFSSLREKTVIYITGLLSLQN